MCLENQRAAALREVGLKDMELYGARHPRELRQVRLRGAGQVGVKEIELKGVKL